MKRWVMDHKLVTAGIVVAVLLIGAFAGGSSETPKPSASPTTDSPIISQRTETTPVGLVVIFKLDREATCSIDTDGDTLPGQAGPQERPAGGNRWAVTGGTQASVSCS